MPPDFQPRRGASIQGNAMNDKRHAGLAAILVWAAIVATPASGADEASPALASTNTQGAPTQGAPPPSVTVLGSKQAQSVLGKQVRSSANENMGRIVDIIVDRAGQVRAAIIDFGGFLGVGNRKIAVDWNALNFSTDKSKSDVITLGLTRDQVKGAPEYKDRKTVVVLGAAGALSPLSYE
jgi:hypothetical protein